MSNRGAGAGAGGIATGAVGIATGGAPKLSANVGPHNASRHVPANSIFFIVVFLLVPGVIAQMRHG
jgi:hypothetical protein